MLFLGDGGNDVSMIQAANVGVGIEGKVHSTQLWDILLFTGLKITAGHRTMTGQKCLLTGHFFISPVILTGHICIHLNRFFSSAYLLKLCQRKTLYFMASTQFHCKYVKLRTTKTLFVLVIYNVIANVLSVLNMKQ